MSFTNIVFLLGFLPVVFLLHNLSCSKNLANLVLLIASIIFYSFYDVKYLYILAFCIIITYLGGYVGYILQQRDHKRSGNAVIIFALIINILILLVCKYTNFAITNINRILHPLGIAITLPNILLPIGLSFYVFQSSSYLFDILSGKLAPEKNIISYALFVSFFPTITSGPIQRATFLLPQINQKRKLTWDQFRHALLLFLWGAFLKMVIADQLGSFTNAVFSNYASYGFLTLLLTMCAYAIQIYTDFAGYSSMAIGIAKLFGFNLEPNFVQPFAATSIAEFWKRWHISLSSWLRDYIYFPLGGNRKGIARKYLNLLIVFLVSGLWHGASWHYVVWGGIHAFYQIFGSITKKYRCKLAEIFGINTNCFSYRLYQRILVFLLFSLSLVFFRMESLKLALSFIHTMCTQWDFHILFDGTLKALGFETITVFAIALLLFVSVLREKGLDIQFFFSQNLIFRWVCYFALIFLIILFGAYGPAFSSSAFIYAGF